MTKPVTTTQGTGSLWVLRGVLGIVFGLVAFAWHPGVPATLFLIFAFWAIMDGAAGVIHYAGDHYGRSKWVFAGGVASVAAGIAALAWPEAQALALAGVIGAWAVVLGATEIAFSFRRRGIEPLWWAMLCSGVLAVAVGVALVFVRTAGVVAFSWVLGAFAVVYGALLIVHGVAIRRLGDDLERAHHATA